MKTSWYYRCAGLAGRLLLATALLTLGSCKEDEAEPSTRDLLIGSWEMLEMAFDGITVEAGDYRLEVEFEPDGDYRETLIEDGVTETSRGEWELSGNELELEYDDGDQWELEITSINKTKLKVEDDEGFEALFEKD